jgi:hypothetical protein
MLIENISSIRNLLYKINAYRGSNPSVFILLYNRILLICKATHSGLPNNNLYGGPIQWKKSKRK